MHEAEFHFRTKLLSLSQLHRPEILQARLRLHEGVERQRRIVLRLVMHVVEGGVFFLQVAGIGQQNATQIYSRRRGVDWSVKPLLYQPRNPSAVVKMRVGEHDGINLPRRNWRILPVPLAPFFWSLEHAAVDQKLKPAVSTRVRRCVDQML